MRKRFSGVVRWAACAAVVACFVGAATPALADRDGRSRSRKPKYREHRVERVYKEKHVYRKPQVRKHSRHSVVIRPQLVRRYEPVQRRYMPFPVWCEQPRVAYYDDRPFFFHASLGVFVSGGSIFVDVGNAPPAGYGYYDPYCRTSFRTVVDYRRHCHGQRHGPLVQVISISDRGHDACDHDAGQCCAGGHDDVYTDSGYDDDYYDDVYYED